MELSRDNFSSSTLDLLDQTASLLYIHQQLRQWWATFDEAKKGRDFFPADDIYVLLEFTRDISGKLMNALFFKESEKGALLADAYKAASTRSAEILKIMDNISQNKAVDKYGNVLSVHVKDQMKMLSEFWTLRYKRNG